MGGPVFHNLSLLAHSTFFNDLESLPAFPLSDPSFASSFVAFCQPFSPILFHHAPKAPLGRSVTIAFVSAASIGDAAFVHSSEEREPSILIPGKIYRQLRHTTIQLFPNRHEDAN